MVDLQFFKTKDLSELNYELDEIQAQFSALPNQALERIKQEIKMMIFLRTRLLFFLMKKQQAFAC